MVNRINLRQRGVKDTAVWSPRSTAMSKGAMMGIRTAFTELVGVEHPLVGFNRSPAVVAEVTKAGGFGVLAATAYTPEQLDAQLTWIEEQVDGRPYGVDLLVPEKVAHGDPANLVASLRAQIPEEHRKFVEQLMDKYQIPKLHDGQTAASSDEIAAALNPAGALALLDVALAHPISLIANALGTPPPSLVDRARAKGIAVAALVGKGRHAQRQVAAGVDVLIAQGTEAGGHTGTIATTVLTPEIVAVAEGRPVLAAGGIASGAQMAAGLALGASVCGVARCGSTVSRTLPRCRSRRSSWPRKARTPSGRRCGRASLPGSCTVPTTTLGHPTASRPCPCRYSPCSSTKRSAASTRPPPKGIPVHWS